MSEDKKDLLIIRAIRALVTINGTCSRAEFFCALPLLFFWGLIVLTLIVMGPAENETARLWLIVMQYLFFAIPATLLQGKRLADTGLWRPAAFILGSLFQLYPALIITLLPLFIQEKINFPWYGPVLIWIGILGVLPSQKPKE